jgi:epoxyqueuosine reductase
VTDGGGGLASPDPAARARAVLGRCAAHGFALAGIAEARPSSHAESFRAWIAAGKQGAMAYLAEELERRLDPRALVPGAASVLCVADRYSDGRPDRRVPWEGSVARYARGEDYHEVIRARLESLAEELRRAHPGERFRVCVDTAPLLEREHAERAGLGRVGKHTLLIGAGGAGTWLLLGCLVSTLPLAAVRADGLPPGAAANDPCGACTACIDACPTGAIRPWSVDGRTCISALTIEQPGGIPGELASRMSGWLFGCDLCQEACPHSQPTRRSRALGIHEAYRPHLPAQLPLAEVLGWTEADLERMRFNAVLRRADLSMWRRNAALAAHGALRSPEVPPDVRAALREALLKVAADRSAAPEARSAASWAVGSS